MSIDSIICFIALTLAGSLGRCLNTRPKGLVFKHLPQDQANVNARNNMCDSYIFIPVHDYQYTRAFYNDAGYRVPRMASEYGLQSYPSYETLVPVYDPEDLFYESDLNDHRQHHIRGKLYDDHLGKKMTTYVHKIYFE